MPPEVTTRAQAAKILGISPDASADVARSAFLKRLRKSQFAGDDAAFAALRHFDVSDDLGTDVDPAQAVKQFADRYWAFPVEARRARWKQLREVTPSKSPSDVWLAALEAGLDVPTYSLGSATRTGELAEQVQWIYTSWPAERPARRRELLRTWSERPAEWKTATTELRRNHRQLANLEAEFVNSRISPSPPTVSAVHVVEDWSKVREEAVETQQKQKEQKAAENPLHQFWWLGFMVFFGAIRACSTSHSNSSTSYPTPRPAPSYPSPTDLNELMQRLEQAKLQINNSKLGQGKNKAGGDDPPRSFVGPPDPRSEGSP